MNMVFQKADEAERELNRLKRKKAEYLSKGIKANLIYRGCWKIISKKIRPL